MRSRTLLFLLVGITVIAAAILVTPSGRNAAWAVFTRMRGRATVADRIEALSPEVRADVEAWCRSAGVEFPPPQAALVGLKRERRLDVYARAGEEWRWLARLPIFGISRGDGPKLAEGDGQVPEGVYTVESLNPNSRFHLALRVDYPNEFDRKMAARDGRTRLGGDIMIHGGSASIGCLAMGDPAIERLFLLCAAVGPESVSVVLAPCDLRVAEPDLDADAPSWFAELHESLRRELARFPVPGTDRGIEIADEMQEVD